MRTSWLLEDEAAQQGVEADKAQHIGALQLNPSVSADIGGVGVNGESSWGC